LSSAPQNVAAIAEYLAWQQGIFHMARYSIRKLGSEYVVLVDGQSILRFTSRRKAEKLVADAAELLSVQSAPAADEPDQSPVKDAKFLDDEGRFP
jgi:hypothetical protein